MKRFTTLSLLISLLCSEVQAQHNVSVSLRRYRFRFEAALPVSADDCFYSRLTVFNRQTGAVVQRVTFDSETAPSLTCRLPVSMLLNATDANNDGYQDALVLSSSAATNQLYDLWLFRPGTGQFRRVLTGLFNPSVNVSRREVRTTHQMGLGSSEQNLYHYRNGSFYLFEIITRNRNDQAGNTRVVVKRLVNGRMRVVRQFVEPDPR